MIKRDNRHFLNHVVGDNRVRNLTFRPEDLDFDYRNAAGSLEQVERFVQRGDLRPLPFVAHIGADVHFPDFLKGHVGDFRHTGAGAGASQRRVVTQNENAVFRPLNVELAGVDSRRNRQLKAGNRVLGSVVQVAAMRHRTNSTGNFRQLSLSADRAERQNKQYGNGDE